jgi:crotonobetainyl-CoA:carnitine CoA-transferase CaiB-like acyl-CoA transferase
MSKLPLSRFKVIDLTHVRAGPTAVRQFADWGADVIRIEHPDPNAGIAMDRSGPDYQNLHRNKRSLKLDLKKPEGLAVFKELVKRSDVLVENYRTEVKFRLGIDYETLRQINPRLVYASISGFGQTGPYRDRPGVDQIAQGMGGLMWITGEPEQGPMRVGIAISDMAAGIFTALGVLVALWEREDSNEGQWVQSSLLASQIAMLDFQAARWLVAKEIPVQTGNNHPTGVPSGVYKTSDGYINMSATGFDLFRRCCKAMGVEHLAIDPRVDSDKARSTNRDELNAILGEITCTKTSAEWIDSLNDAGVPCGPIYRMNEVFADPQVKHIGIAAPVDHPTLGHIELVGQPVSMSRTPFAIRTPTQEPGQNTNEILHELGYSDSAIAQLRADKVI